MSIPPAQQVQGGPRYRLHDAANRGSVEGTVALLSSGLVDIDEGDPMGWTPLMRAVQGDYLPVARILLSKGANVSIVNNDDDHGYTALLLATHYGHLAITKLLLKAGADIETPSSHGLTPLHIAAYHGFSEVMRVLIQAGANPNSRMPRDETPLYLAAHRGYVDAIRELLRAGAKPLLYGTSGGKVWLPLHAAVEEGHSEVAHELIREFGMEGCCDGTSAAVEALRLAARNQHVGIMAMLMEAGAIDTGAGLIAAAGTGSEASVKFLLQQQKGETTGGSAYVDFRDSDGMTPLLSSIVFCHSSSPRVARLLIDAGADSTSAVRGRNGRAGGDVQLDSTPLGVTDLQLRVKKVNGKPAAKEQLDKLEAIRRLLLQVAAVHAVSWLWPSGIPFIARAAERSGRARMELPPLAGMLPILRRRAGRRGVLLSALFRYSSKPGPGSTREV